MAAFTMKEIGLEDFLRQLDFYLKHHKINNGFTSEVVFNK